MKTQKMIFGFFLVSILGFGQFAFGSDSLSATLAASKVQLKLKRLDCFLT